MFSLMNVVKGFRTSDKKEPRDDYISLEDDLDSKPSGISLIVKKTQQISERFTDLLGGKEKAIPAAVTVTVVVLGMYIYRHLKYSKSKQVKSAKASDANWLGYRHITRSH